jgi:hypothetical protein
VRNPKQDFSWKYWKMEINPQISAFIKTKNKDQVKSHSQLMAKRAAPSGKDLLEVAY